jgi:hypothetical protein
MAEEATGNTLNATTLFHEACLRLIDPVNMALAEDLGNGYR